MWAAIMITRHFELIRVNLLKFRLKYTKSASYRHNTTDCNKVRYTKQRLGKLKKNEGGRHHLKYNKICIFINLIKLYIVNGTLFNL